MDKQITKEIDIHDHIAEAYYGKFGKKIQEEAVERIHWIRDNVIGNRILDVGCSQGIGPILLGRQGKKVDGIDISKKAVDEAKEALLKENSSVKDNVTFIQNDFLKYDNKKNRFDTITMTEILEHLYEPDEFVYKAYDLLNKDGTIIVTVPFGINDFPDHKKTYYYYDMYQMLYRYFDIQKVHFLGKWIGFVGTKRSSIVDAPLFIDLKMLETIEKNFYKIDREQTDAHKNCIVQRNKANEKYRDLWDKVRLLTTDLESSKKTSEELKSDLESSRKTIKELKSDLESSKKTIESQKIDVNKYKNEVIACKNSATFQLGYLLINKTRKLTDIIKLPYRLKKIKDKKSNNIIPNDENQKKMHIHTNRKENNALKPGVSVIVPSYKSEDTIERLLNSLEEQILDKKLFEVIIIINGLKDSTESIVNRFKKEHEDLNILTLYSKSNNASSARNIGIDKAHYEFISFVDDDDSVSPNYLSEMYALSNKNTIVFSQVVDIYKHHINANNYVNSSILNTRCDDKKLFLKCHSALRLLACKLIETKFIQNVKFDTTLTNGEDGVFYADLYSKFDFKFKMCKNATYYRFVVANSLSRQPMSYQFNVTDRLKVIAKNLLTLETCNKPDVIKFINIGIGGQIGFINKYLEYNPNDYYKVVDEIKLKDINNFPYKELKKPVASELVISYCFTPYVDTSAIVMSKRIMNRGNIVDVVYANMNKNRNKDNQLLGLAKELISNRIEISSPISFGNWNGIKQFCNQTIKKLENINRIPYETVYSRVMWPASNFVAFEYKLKYPNTKWIAEFSDPISYDIHGKLRYGKIDKDWHWKDIEALLEIKNIPMPKNDNLFFWCEYLAFLFADEIIMTNNNQRTYMLEKMEENIYEIASKKITISEHPTLSKPYYSLVKSMYELKTDKINLAYFGAFYQTRKLNDIFEIIKILDTQYRKRVLIHIFTETKDELMKTLHKENIASNFVVNDYVPYLEFLNLTTKFDCLILNDAITKPMKHLNPYLPSKLSDYLGGSASIWALYEEGSIIHKSINIRYKSELGKINESCKELKKIIDDKNKIN